MIIYNSLRKEKIMNCPECDKVMKEMWGSVSDVERDETYDVMCGYKCECGYKMDTNGEEVD